MAVRDVTELAVYKKSYALAMHIFAVSKRFPTEERYALTGQIRRSSRSVSMNLREAWAKRNDHRAWGPVRTECRNRKNAWRHAQDPGEVLLNRPPAA
jgi:hypothetical protein